jgi:phosphate transport system substrate-binding protein
MKILTTMSVLKWWITLLACCVVMKAGAVKRLYVEPFTTRAGAEKLREDVIGEIRRRHSISIVSAAPDADAILGGGGEIWIKGYRSLNPRSGRSPSDGTPVYSGYLAVELRDKEGETLWSDLVTPKAASEDVSKDLSKRIAKDVALALESGLAAPARSPLLQPAAVLKGAGATFPYPVYAKWFTNYRLNHPAVEITYQPIGSEAGIRKLLAAEVDFGATDNPDAVRGDYLLFPSVVVAVVPIVNLPGFPAEIHFTPQALAGIYLGKITKWNDPMLREANRGLQLPDLDIVVIHREDGSGTSYAWTDYLSKISPEWKAQAGAGFAPKWPTGRPANGNDGVAKLVKELGGSIGYVEFIYALQNHLSYGRVRNADGQFIGASLESVAIAVNNSAKIQDDLKVSIVNPPGAGAYPICSFSWLVVPAHMADSAKRNAMADFLKWMLGPGQTQAAALGYLALPVDVVRREQTAVAALQ